MIRDDLSDRLVHLTRGETEQAAANRFLSIVEKGAIQGGTTCIRGGYRCVCFSEAPLSKLAAILANPGDHGMRYSPFGAMVSKRWLYERGGRPVIYQADHEFDSLPEDLRYRHVRYEPDAVDFTWEREWRIQVDELALQPEETTLIAPTREWERWLLEKHMSRLQIEAVAFDGWVRMPPPPWHFVVLEDLGVEIPSLAAPP